ncbi:hypothetical protein [Bacillus sp. FSL K6-2839]|uniref:hypothetical protein n=1 Tax=Bacillus sp. FSL K6-2839 TaxID=2921480 RepID=UPI0030F54972
MGWFLGLVSGVATDIRMKIRNREDVTQIKTHEELRSELTVIEKEMSRLGTVKNEIRKQLNAVCPHEDTYLVDSWGSMDDEIKYKCRNCYGYITEEQNENREID